MAGIAGKNIVLGVTGGIAAYKAVELVSRLKKAGAEVHVVMTRAAQEFVTELTFREISGHAVATDMWGEVQEFHVEHIALAQLADLVVVAPATANFIAKVAAGIADDLLTTTLLATKAPIFVAPAMNTNMYENPLTQRNLEILRRFGVHVMEPAEGQLACGVSGKGRLPEPSALADEILCFFERKQSLNGCRILVTAAGTREPIDPVRYIGNRSSGKMGYAIAAKAAMRGAEVILVSGPSALQAPAGVKLVRVESAAEMRDAVWKEYEAVDAVIMSAAVADYRVKTAAPEKIKKTQDEWMLPLVKNPDILYELGRHKKRQILIGFAAETQNVLEYARGKLEKKNLDYIVANDVTEDGAGFNTDTNRILMISRTGEVERFPLMRKTELADIILDRLETWKDKTSCKI
ncbi:MAG: bifunctional phosphopantothenoylcysteine decarboxylase/phosphopantothenate--cysteine ligase CoaBC [Selenomonadaceae bacterium]|nr:bifunctional phosphopantothenoylcysteine decarboxylase/phosphopantothenate--cysteine ligase CoaBC [Selenomonadaceae bacterium]